MGRGEERSLRGKMQAVTKNGFRCGGKCKRL